MLVTLSFACFSQPLVEYSPEFKFRDGIYLSIHDFKNNHPIPLTHILSDFDIQNPDYLDFVLNNDSVTYFDNHYEERSASILELWGYSKAGKIYIGYNTVENSVRWDNRGWFPLLSVGAYSYFTAVVTVSRFIPPTPGALMQSRGTILDDGAFYPDEGSYYDESIPIQLLLDYADGSIIKLASGDLNSVAPKLVSELISSDHELSAEFEQLPKRDQKHSAMFYLRKYNMRNPISFPDYGK